MRFFYSLMLSMLLTGAIFAQDNSWSFSGQAQMRSELDGRDFNNSSFAPFMTVMRTRLGVAKKFNEKAEFFFQAQDSRLFGQAGSPSTYTKNMDVYQAYIKLNEVLDLPLSIQVGRFSMSYGTERFIGVSNWSHIGRAFDGVRFSTKVAGNLDVFALTNNDARAYVSNATSGAYPTYYSVDNTSSLYGIYDVYKFSDEWQEDVFILHDLNRKKTNGTNADVSVTTIGNSTFYTTGALSLVSEIAYQTGNRGAKDVSAYLLSVSGTYKVNMHKIGLGVDLISGTEDVTKDDNVYYTTYGTNHKFYGYMDYFTDMNKNTMGLGLIDIYGTWDILPSKLPYSFSVNLHHFLTEKDPKTIDGVYGQELDLTFKYKFAENTTFTWGGSVFIPGELMKSAFQLGTTERKDPGLWSYCMITANF